MKTRKQKRFHGGAPKCTFRMDTIQVDTRFGKQGVLGQGTFGKASANKNVTPSNRGFLRRIIDRIYTNKIIDNNDQYYVVKTVNHPKYTRTAQQEATILHQLTLQGKHKNILYYYGCNEHPTMNIITEYNVGYDNMQSFIYANDSGELSNDYQHIWTAIRQLYEGLSEIHRRGVLHRDIKPENIIINKQNGHIKYIDFGVSDIITPNRIDYGFQGTVTYLPPIIYSLHKKKKQKQQYRLDETMLVYGDYWALSLVIYQLWFVRPEIMQNGRSVSNRQIEHFVKTLMDMVDNKNELNDIVANILAANAHVSFKYAELDQRLKNKRIPGKTYIMDYDDFMNMHQTVPMLSEIIQKNHRANSIYQSVASEIKPKPKSSRISQFMSHVRRWGNRFTQKRIRDYSPSPSPKQ